MQTLTGDKPEIFKTTRDNFILPFLFLVMGIAGFIAYTQGAFLPVDLWLVTAIPIAFSAVLFYRINSKYALHLYPDRLEVVTMGGRTRQTIYRNELTGWSQIEYEGRHAYTSFTLLTYTRSYRFIINRYSDNKRFVRFITKGLPRKSEREKTILYRQGLAIAWALGIVIAAMITIGVIQFLTAS